MKIEMKCYAPELQNHKPHHTLTDTTPNLTAHTVWNLRFVSSSKVCFHIKELILISFLEK